MWGDLALGGRCILATVFVAGTLAAAPVQGSDSLTLLYQDRPPYYITNPDGSIGGVVAGRVSRSLQAAGIKAEWKVRPGKRQIETIRHNRGAICSPGWFKKPEREKFAKFSDTIYRDKPQVVVIRALERDQFPHQRLADLFADRRHSFGAKLGYSYGGFVDKLIDTVKPETQRTPQDVIGMVRMLAGRRFDYMLTAEEEFETLRISLEDATDTIIALKMGDIPPGNKRYLMCSKKVSDGLISRFNKALASLPK